MCVTTVPFEFWCHCSHCCGSEHHRLETLLIAFLLWKLVWHFLLPWKLVFREETFRSVLAQHPLGPVSAKEHVVFSQLWGQGREIAISCMFWKSLGQPWPTTQKRDSHIWVFVFRWSLALGRNIVNSDKKSSFKVYMYIYIQNYISYRFFYINS